MFRNNFSLGSFFCLSLFFVTACTQQPAPVEYKGGQSYSRGSQSGVSSSYSSYGSSSSYNRSPNITVSEATEQSAAVDSIGVSDLSPPTPTSPSSESKSSESKAQLKSETLTLPSSSDAKPPAKPEDSKDKNIGGLKTTVNPWTNKPRSSNEVKQDTPQVEAKIDTSNEKIEEPNEDIAAKTEKKIEEAIIEKPEQKLEKTKATTTVSYQWPVESKKIVSSFGSKGAGRVNDGVNISAKDGDKVWAVADGEVVYVSNDLKGYGNMVLIKHKGGKTSSYAHLGRVVVDKYDRVKQGDVIGHVGMTGDIKTPQLFFSIHDGKKAIDPQKLINS